MNEVLLFNIEENGFLSALPHVASFLVVVSTGVNTRKLFHGIGTLSPALCLLLISFLNCERRYLAVLLLVIGVALK
jgi:ACS family sodium-dependent inorganic phosphate cotransporter-like MFS transporter 5